MLISSLPLRPPMSRIARRLTRSSLPDLAAETIELSPARSRHLPPAICLPDEFDRVKGFDATTNLETQKTFLLSSNDPNGATRAYRLRDVLMTPEGIFHRRGFEVLRPRVRWSMVRDRIDRRDEAQLCTTCVAQTYFGHWFRDGLTLELLAEERGLEKAVPLRKPWLHEGGYRDLTSLPQPEGVAARHYKDLWVIDDLALNAPRIARMRELGRRIRRNVVPANNEFVFMRRGRSGVARRLMNENEIIAKLGAAGFAIIDPERMTASAIAARLAAARMVIGVEGSAISHASICAPEGAALLVIQPPYRFNAMARAYAPAFGHHYAYTVADPCEGGFFQPVDRLMATIDLTLKTAAQFAVPGMGTRLH